MGGFYSGLLSVGWGKIFISLFIKRKYFVLLGLFISPRWSGKRLVIL